MSLPELHVRLEFGDDTDLTDDTLSCTVRRGLALDGVTDQPNPASFVAVIIGSDDSNPLTNPDLRPDRAVRLQIGVEDVYGTDITWHTLWTGAVSRDRIEHTESAKHDPDDYRVQVTGTDIVPTLNAIPSDVAVSGSLTQRADAILTGTGIVYDVTDLSDPGEVEDLPTNQRTVLGQLRLVRDTLHAAMFVDRDGTLQLVDDSARSRTVFTPDFVATDEDPAPDGAILYFDITPVFDTDVLVNVLTITSLADSTDTTYTNEDSRADWGSHSQTVTVNDGVIETHADLYLATRVEPDLVPDSIAFVVDPYDDAFTSHLLAACAIEIGDTIDVTRLGVTHRLEVRELAHTIVAVQEPVLRLRWTVEVGLRVPDVLATRWDDVPSDLTWDDLPDDLTWNSAVYWHPYNPEEA